MGKWDIAFPDSKQDFKDLDGKLMDAQDAFEELHDRLDIPSFWFHGETIKFGYSFSFPLLSLKEDAPKVMSNIVMAVTDGTDLVEAALAEPNQYRRLSSFYSYAKYKSMQGLPRVISNLTEYSFTEAAVKKLLSDYFTITPDYFTNIRTDTQLSTVDNLDPDTDFTIMALAYIQKTGEYWDIRKELLYKTFLEKCEELVLDMAWTSNSPIPEIDINDYEYFIESIETTTQDTISWRLFFDVNIKAVLKTDHTTVFYFTDKMAIPNDSDIVLYWGEKYLFYFDTPEHANVLFIMCQTTPRYTDFQEYLEEFRITTEGNFYPAIPIKLNKEFLDESDKLANMYTDAKGLSTALGIDYSYLKTAVESLDGIKDRNVDGAYAYFGVDVNSDNEIELEYCYRFFKDKAKEFKENPQAIYEENGVGRYELDVGYGMKINKDDKHRTALHQYFICSDITMESRTGTMPTDASVFGLVGTKYKTYYTKTKGNYLLVIILPKDKNDDWSSVEFAFCKKLSNSKYDFIKITNPHFFVQTLDNKENKIHYISVLKLGLENAHLCRLPLSDNYIKQFSTKDRNDLIVASLCINVMARSDHYVDWYATKDFQTFVTVVSIIVTIWSLGTSSSFWIWLRNVLIALAAAKAGAWVARKVGGDLGVALGFITTMVILYYGGGLSSVSGNTTFMQASVQNAVIAADALSKIHSIKIQEQMDKLRRETAMFDKNYKEAMEIIEDAKDELLKGSGIKYELSQLIDELDYIYESPDDFLYRTTQMKNPGVLLLQEANTYVARHLQLPDYLSQTNIIT